MKDYFYIKDNERQGPFSFDELKTHRITENTLVWTEGLDNWVPAGEVPDLESLLISSPPPLPEVGKKMENSKIPTLENREQLKEKISQSLSSVTKHVVEREKEENIEVSFRPFIQEQNEIIGEINIDENFKFIEKNKEKLFSDETIKDSAEIISRYKKLKALIGDYRIQKSKGKRIWPLINQFSEFKDFKISKIREEIANDYWSSKKSVFWGNSLVFIILALISFFSILQTGKYLGAYPGVLSMFHILALPIAFFLFFFLFNLNTKRKIKETIIKSLSLKDAKLVFFSKTILPGILLIIFSLIICGGIFYQKGDIEDFNEKKRALQEFEVFKTENPVIVLNTVRSNSDSVFFIDITKNLRHNFFIPEGTAYFAHKGGYVSRDYGWQGIGEKIRIEASNRIYVNYSFLDYQKDIRRPEKIVTVNKVEGGIPLETYPGFLRFDAAEDDVEIIYMHRDFDSYINNVQKRTFIPKRELEAFLENAKKYPQFDQRIMEKFVNLPVFQIKELRKNEFPAEEVNIGTCNGDKVNIRESNTVNSNVITQLSKGDKVQILETGIAGRSDEGQLLIDVPIRDNQGYIIFNARKGQALKIIEKLWNGFKVELLTREGNFYSIIKEEDFEYINNNSWVKVKISSGEIGYCVEDYIDF